MIFNMNHKLDNMLGREKAKAIFITILLIYLNVLIDLLFMFQGKDKKLY